MTPKPCARFWLPLHVAPTLNTYSRMHWGRRGRLKLECVTHMLSQINGRPSKPLEGKPTVVAVRFSARPTDQDAGWTKIPLDCLKADKQGLGYLRDDSPDAVEVKTSWQKVKLNDGCVLVEIYEEEP